MELRVFDITAKWLDSLQLLDPGRFMHLSFYFAHGVHFFYKCESLVGMGMVHLGKMVVYGFIFFQTDVSHVFSYLM